MRLYAMKDYVGTEVGTENPTRPTTSRVRGAHWLDHRLLMCELNPETGVNKVAENTKSGDMEARLLPHRANHRPRR